MNIFAPGLFKGQKQQQQHPEIRIYYPAPPPPPLPPLNEEEVRSADNPTLPPTKYPFLISKTFFVTKAALLFFGIPWMPTQSAPSSSSSCCSVDGIASMEGGGGGGGGRWIFVSSSFSHTRTEEKSGAKRRENNFLGPRFTDSPKHSGVSLGRKLPKDVLTFHRIFL